jgi:hypothetical protein
LASALKRGSFVYLSTGTHAMAAQVGTAFVGATVDFYDPNVGELGGTKLAAIGSFLKEVMEATMAATGQPNSDLSGRAVTVSCFRKA